MSKKKQRIADRKIDAGLNSADMLALAKISEAASHVSIQEVSIAALYNPIKDTFALLPDWVLYRLVQVKQGSDDHAVGLLLMTQEVLSRFDFVPGHGDIKMSMVIMGAFTFIAIGTLARRHGIENEELLDAIQKFPSKEKPTPEMKAIIMQFVDSKASLGEPSTFDLVRFEQSTSGKKSFLYV